MIRTTGFGGWLAEQVVHTSATALYGSVIGFAWGTYKWRRWHQ
jgi:hypothetical protein